MVVSVSLENDLARVEIDNPPVNATSQAVRAGLLAALAQVENDPQIKAVVLSAAGRTFVAGGDIKEFDAAPVPPHLPDVLCAIEGCAKPWIAALHGSVFGGGLELAMACHGRVAAPGTQLGLPEVNLGLIPGAGGTVRLPRLINPAAALTMIAGGKPISADRALELGLIDLVADIPLIDAAKALADRIQPAATLERPIAPFNADTYQRSRAQLVARARGQRSIIAATEAVARALSLSAEDALAAERAAFTELKSSEQSKALRHVFFAERATLTDPRCKGPTRDIATVGIVGGGTMGAGIAATFLLAGLPVHMVERDAAAAQTGAARVQEILGQSLKRGVLSPADHAAKLDLFRATHEYAGLGSVDLVVEAVFEGINELTVIRSKG